MHATPRFAYISDAIKAYYPPLEYDRDVAPLQPALKEIQDAELDIAERLTGFFPQMVTFVPLYRTWQEKVVVHKERIAKLKHKIVEINGKIQGLSDNKKQAQAITTIRTLYPVLS